MTVHLVDALAPEPSAALTDPAFTMALGLDHLATWIMGKSLSAIRNSPRRADIILYLASEFSG